MSCSCNSTPCSCSPCSPSNVVFQSDCTDPGSITSLRYLLGLDSSFCDRRLIPPSDGGLLVARPTGNGGFLIYFTTAPVVALGETQAVINQVFGNLLVQGSDNIMRELLGPATAGLILTTNAAGELIFTTLPPATVPDPLTVGTLTVTGTTTLASAVVSGTINFTGLGTGALVSFVGLDGSGNLIKGSAATTGTQIASFFESPTSPSGATPNSGATSGTLLVIGNLIFDSVGTPGGALFTVTNSQTLTCLTAGVYAVDFGGQVTYTGGSDGRPSIALLVNGLAVNNGNGRSDGAITSTQRSANLWGRDMRRYAAGDTIQLQLGSSSGTNTHVYEARVNMIRTGT